MKKTAETKKVKHTVKNEIPATHWAGNIPDVEPGKYADGLPFRELNYLCCKLTLKTNLFVSRKSLLDFGKVLKRAGKNLGVKFSSEEYVNKPISIREVIFKDTSDFRLYNNSFILRRRITYKDGFPVGEPEVVFKFRHSDLQKTAAVDVRPNISGAYTVKFKCQALPLKGELGGIRMLYSHNVEFPRSHATNNLRFSMNEMSEIFPALKDLKISADDHIDLVNNTIVEEVLQDIGELNFGKGIRAVASVAVWRTRGEHLPLIGELSFQIKFRNKKTLHITAMQRIETFFIALQYEAKDWIDLETTKTGTVYNMLGNSNSSLE